MLKEYAASPVRAWYYRILLPVSFLDISKMLLPAVMIGGIAALAFHDLGIFIICIALGYLCVIFIGRSFADYQIKLDKKKDLEYVVELLDRTDRLMRNGDLRWIRIKTPSFLRSKSDRIVISDYGASWVVRGRRYDILSLAVALKQRENTVTGIR